VAHCAEPNSKWTDVSGFSDEYIERLAFYGQSSLALEDLAAGDPDGAAFVADYRSISGLEVRDSFVPYGAAAFFTENQKLVRIERSGKSFHPGNAGWAHAKFAWKATMGTYITLVDHLVGCHFMVANNICLAAYSKLPCDHPIRQYLKPFTYRSVLINLKACETLIPVNSMFHRASALTAKGIDQAFPAAFQLATNFRSFPDLIKDKGPKIQQLMKEDKYPFGTDGCKLHEILLKFTTSYVETLYPSDQQVVDDVHIQDFWKMILEKLDIQKAQYDWKPTCTTRAELASLLTQHVFIVSGYHELFGTIAELVNNREACGLKIRPGQEEVDPQALLQNSVILALTSLRMPMLCSDFSHLWDAEVKGAWMTCLDDLSALSKDINKRNTTRRFPCDAFNPEFLECSISV